MKSYLINEALWTSLAAFVLVGILTTTMAQ